MMFCHSGTKSLEGNGNGANLEEEVTDDNCLLDIIICGEVLLVKNQWRVCLACSFCGQEATSLEELLAHSLGTHLSDVTTDDVAEVLEELKSEGEKVLTLVEEIDKTEPEEDLEEHVEDFKENDQDLKENENFEEQEDDFYEIGRLSYEDEDVKNEVNSDTVGLFKGFEPSEQDVESNSIEDECQQESSDDVMLKSLLPLQPTQATQPPPSTSTENGTSGEVIDFEMVFIKSITNEVNAKEENPNMITGKTKRRGWKKNQGKGHICPKCNKSFKRAPNLKAHLNLHAGLKPFPCKYCKVCFADQTNLKVHEYRHLGIKPHKCKHCERGFTTGSELTLHMRSHTGERPFRCDTCGRGYSNSAHLTEHRRRHTNDRPFLCPTCGKSFYDSYYLRNHQASHSKERLFACEQCAATFTRRNGLSQHLKLHNDPKNYVCKICNKSYKHKAALRAHLKRAKHSDKSV